jgi:hypothetical protein
MKKLFSPLVTRISLLLIATIVLLGGIFNPQYSSKKLDVVTCNGHLMTESQVAEFRGISLETIQLLHTQRGLTSSEICVIPKVNRQFCVNDPMPDHPSEGCCKLQLRMRMVASRRCCAPTPTMMAEQGINANLHRLTGSWTLDLTLAASAGNCYSPQIPTFYGLKCLAAFGRRPMAAHPAGA